MNIKADSSVVRRDTVMLTFSLPPALILRADVSMSIGEWTAPRHYWLTVE